LEGWRRGYVIGIWDSKRELWWPSSWFVPGEERRAMEAHSIISERKLEGGGLTGRRMRGDVVRALAQSSPDFERVAQTMSRGKERRGEVVLYGVCGEEIVGRNASAQESR
jgi:hypothetical protein